MLRSLKTMLGYLVETVEGDIGQLQDFLFDDLSWNIRHAVVQTGGWLFGQEVLLAPGCLRSAGAGQHKVRVNMSATSVRNCPGIDSDIPVSRQQRFALDGYYGWSATLAAGGMLAAPFMPSSITEGEQARGAELARRSDPHLRSAKEVTGYHMQSRDGVIGHIDDYIIDDEGWIIVHLVVDMRNWLHGRRVLVPPAWATGIYWNLRMVTADAAADSIRQCPTYDPHAHPAQEHTNEFLHHAGHHA